MKQRILLVDDDADALAMLRLILQRRGYEVMTAQSGMQALSSLAHELPDVVILDIMMPQMDGYQVCRRIKTDPRTAHLPVALFSAKSQPVDQMEGFRAGADDFIEKPVHPDTLIERINTLLERAAGAPKEKAARVISVLGAKGGVGATTLAVNLALALPGNIILADLEPGGTAALYLGLDPVHGLNDLLARQADSLDQAAIEAALVPHPSGLRVLAAADNPLDQERLSVLLDHLLVMCDVGIFDLGGGLVHFAATIADRSNDLILALDSDRATLAQARRVMNGLLEAGLAAKAKLVWINRSGASAEAGRAAIRTTLGNEPVAVIDSAADAMYRAVEQGQPLVIGQPDHAIVAQVRALTELLMNPPSPSAEVEQ